MRAIVLCGGLGTRLGSLTKETPKPLLSVAGRPFIDHLLDRLADACATELVLAVGFQWRKLHDHIGTQWKGIPVTYSVESTPLGTGGAIKFAMAQARAEEALIVNGDTLFAIDLTAFVQFAKSHDTATTLALREVPDCSRYGRVTIGQDSQVLSFGEKGCTGAGLINAGVYYQRACALANISTDVFSFETDYLAVQHRLQPMYAVPMDGYFIDIGIPSDLQRAQTELLKLTFP